MAKGQPRGNREAKKPKADKPKGSVSAYKQSLSKGGQSLIPAYKENLTRQLWGAGRLRLRNGPALQTGAPTSRTHGLFDPDRARASIRPINCTSSGVALPAAKPWRK